MGGGERVSREHAQRLHATLARHPHSTHNALTQHSQQLSHSIHKALTKHPHITHKAFTTHSQRSHAHFHTNLTTSPRGARRIFSAENPRARTRKSDLTSQHPPTSQNAERREEEKKKKAKLSPRPVSRSLPFLTRRPAGQNAEERRREDEKKRRRTPSWAPGLFPSPSLFSLASRPSCRAFSGWGRCALTPPTSNIPIALNGT